MSETAEDALTLDIRGNVLHGFGRWNGEPMDWLILRQENDLPDGRMLLFSLRPVAERPYDIVTADQHARPWLECALHDWLNGEFLNGAFSEGERERIANCGPTGRVFVPQEDQLPRAKEKRASGTAWWLRKEFFFEDSDDVPCVEAEGDIKPQFVGDSLSVFPMLWVSPFSREKRLEEISRWEAWLLQEEEDYRKRQAELKHIRLSPAVWIRLKRLELSCRRAEAKRKAKAEKREQGQVFVQMAEAEKAAKKAKRVYDEYRRKVYNEPALQLNSTYLSNTHTQLEWIRTVKEDYGFIPPSSSHRYSGLEQRWLLR